MSSRCRKVLRETSQYPNMIYYILSKGRQPIYCVIGIRYPIHVLDKNGTGLLMSKFVNNIIFGGPVQGKLFLNIYPPFYPVPINTLLYPHFSTIF